MSLKYVKPAGFSLLAIHGLALISLFWLQWELQWVLLCIGSYYIRMFGITAGFHRLFSHKSFKAKRWYQFLLGALGTAAIQRGPIWWAAIHRHHHRHSDKTLDIHSPKAHGFFQSHLGWVFDRSYKSVTQDHVKDLQKFPEIVWLDRHYLVPPAIYGAILLAIFGWQGFLWGFLISTVLLWHGTFLINSLCHIVGSRRFETRDDSRNSFLLALLTMGEGWHNNHHFYPGSARQGFYWWEVDFSYYLIKLSALLGWVTAIKEPIGLKNLKLSPR
ncbi:acyl-CoA desaturase [Pseudobacteriovorax antillogorgiicola]|uniref:Delta-9 acyl-phospholipid desaturase n=1 Tax=Pseudobacteriovorax antillogorgiicola TaxID=1513793 RepID=A0A1Y6C9T4_9BACT|nr:fatty acid desaturase [Pseudobacteriovorax antillogorgiicola]TCS48989.1 Delta-9 acyl-phospholipid desaturase [Pseudobacteriovorax antillogorgiicola]SMF53427.1 Delta-9 acyl-phospholipid desaturase [Pseudobacteriovorax antillogorgiicola]